MDVLLIIIFSILFHEVGHLLFALLFKVKIKIFSIGFGKPYLKFKVKNVEVRLSPILLGGYVLLEGETEKCPNGFLSLPYIRKVILLLSGVLFNLLICFIIYLINYKSIIIGLSIDWAFIKSIVLKDSDQLLALLPYYRYDFNMLMISSFNLACVLFNILPLPPLDGGNVLFMLLEKFVPLEKFLNMVKKINYLGFILLIILQIIFIIYWFIF